MDNTAGAVNSIDVLPESLSGWGFVWGRSLRFVLVGELMKRPEASVAELVAWLSEQGFEVRGRASKIVSDGLRWEIRRGRVTRLGRGRYRYNRAPATTARRIKLFAAQCLAWIVAMRRHEQPPPTPPDPRAAPLFHPHDPTHPPWQNTAWLWST